MKKTFILLVATTMLFLAACGTNNSEKNTTKSEVNLYTSRHYDVDNDLYKKFEKETGIKVNLIKGEADELIERIKREGNATKAGSFLNG